MASKSDQSRQEKHLKEFLLPYLQQGYFTHYFAACGSLSASSPTLAMSYYESGQRIFDLASLTKALVTTPLVLSLVRSHGLLLQETIQDWLEKTGNKSDHWPSTTLNLTVESLLQHRSGLPAWRNFWINRLDEKPLTAYFRDRVNHIQTVFSRIPIVAGTPGNDTYSDIGFMMLGLLVETILKKPLDQAFHALGKQIGFVSAAQPAEAWLGFPAGLPLTKPDLFVPTTHCALRRRLLQGEVHDENCASLGGICGHAGLFGTGEGVLLFIKSWFHSPDGQDFLARHRALSLGADQKPVVTGWRPGDDDSSRTFGGGRAIGHMGFTGTAFWVDPQKLTYGIFLTNRIVSGRRSPRIKEVRREVFSQFQMALDAGIT